MKKKRIIGTAFYDLDLMVWIVEIENVFYVEFYLVGKGQKYRFSGVRKTVNEVMNAQGLKIKNNLYGLPAVIRIKEWIIEEGF